MNIELKYNNSLSYGEKRQGAYPLIAEQLDMLWHAIDSGTLDKTSDFYKKLSNPWTTIHSLQIASDGGGYFKNGEIDFLSIHPDYGLILTEVKGEGITFKEGNWYRNEEKTKGPYDQIESQQKN